MVWVESVSACKTSLGQMISVQFCHKSLNAWLGGKAVGRLCFNISSHWLTSRILKEEKMGVISKSRFFLKNALMIHRNVKSKSILAAGKVVHFEWKDKCVQKLGRNKQRTWSRNMKKKKILKVCANRPVYIKHIHSHSITKPSYSLPISCVLKRHPDCHGFETFYCSHNLFLSFPGFLKIFS